MEQKQYSAITVQEIIDEANIGRSTFYAHFETKDDLLRSLCSEIFCNVFTDLLPQEEDTPDRQISGPALRTVKGVLAICSAVKLAYISGVPKFGNFCCFFA